MTHDPGSGNDDPLRIGGVGRARSPTAAGGVDSADATAPPGATAGSEGVAGTSAIDQGGAVAPSDAIAEGLASGAIDAESAKSMLIDQAVAAALPAGADPALVAEIRAEVEAMLAGDPVLDQLLR